MSFDFREYQRAERLLEKTEVPEGESGPWKIERFTVSKEEADFFNLRQLINFCGSDRRIEEGTYTRLVREKAYNPMMSDTPAEMRDHVSPVMHAKGHCLIMGLGLGMVVEACLRKEEVDLVTVIEIDEDIISLVEPHLSGKWGERLEIITDDALTWRPPKDARYGMAWFDIWADICEDNLPDMKLLTRRFGQKAEWKGSWGREIMRRW